MYYRTAAAAVLVHDVTSKSSLDGLEDWEAEIADKASHKIMLFVVGNKAKKIQAVFYAETSAKQGDGINELFTKIAELDLAQEEDVVDTFKGIPPRQKNSKQEGSCC
jgi:GTPase SAR1 family protein